MCACTSTYMFVLGRCVCFCICGPSFVFGRMYLYLQLMYFSVCDYHCSLCIWVWVACVFAEQKKMWSRLLLPPFATLWLTLSMSGSLLIWNFAYKVLALLSAPLPRWSTSFQSVCLGVSTYICSLCTRAFVLIYAACVLGNLSKTFKRILPVKAGAGGTPPFR